MSLRQQEVSEDETILLCTVEFCHGLEDPSAWKGFEK